MLPVFSQSAGMMRPPKVGSGGLLQIKNTTLIDNTICNGLCALMIRPRHEGCKLEVEGTLAKLCAESDSL